MTKSSIPSPVQFSMEHWRNRFVLTVLRAASILGLLALIFAFTPDTIPLLRGFYVVAYGVILIATFAPVPVFGRAGLVITLTYLLAVSSFLDVGLWGVSRLYLLGFILFANLLFSYRASLAALAVSILTLGIFGWLIITGKYAISSTVVQAGGISDWAGGAVTFLMIAFTINLAVNMLQTEFQRAYSSGQEILTQLSSNQRSLEDRVSERTASLEKRTAELSAANDVARRISEARDIEVLLPVVVHTIGEKFGYYHAGIYLLDDKFEYGFLQAASSDGGKRMLARQHQIHMNEDGILQRCALRQTYQIVHNIPEETSRLENPDLPSTRARGAFPLLTRERVIGILDIHSADPNAFQQSEVETMQIIADQLSLAIDNSRLFADMQAIIEQMQQAGDMRSYLSWAETARQRSSAYQYTPLAVQKIGTAQERREGPGTLSIPINLRGNSIGKIHLKRKTGTGIWLEQEQAMVREIATQIGLALENARLLEDAQTRAARERSLSEIATRISSASDVESILRTTVQEIGKALGDTEVSVKLQTEGTDS